MASKRSHHGASKRTRARAQVLQLLYADGFTPRSDPAAALAAATAVMDDLVLEKYARELYEGVLEHLEDIDAAIKGASENWAISRMPLTDRSILRIATFELLYRPDIPAGVSINEAVELAQAFGGEDDSHRFVNGVLGKIASSLAGDTGDPAPDAADAETGGQTGAPAGPQHERQPEDDEEARLDG